MTQPLCEDTDPERCAGEPVDDPWGDTVDLSEYVVGGDTDGKLDSGSVPGDAQG